LNLKTKKNKKTPAKISHTCRFMSADPNQRITSTLIHNTLRR
jgi:hypothetical protein